jgi:hypothetical protein
LRKRLGRARGERGRRILAVEKEKILRDAFFVAGNG